MANGVQFITMLNAPATLVPQRFLGGGGLRLLSFDLGNRVAHALGHHAAGRGFHPADLAILARLVGRRLADDIFVSFDVIIRLVLGGKRRGGADAGKAYDNRQNRISHAGQPFRESDFRRNEPLRGATLFEKVNFVGELY
jgi:hypothetical protein